MSNLTQQIQIFTSADGQVKLEITQTQETLWLSQVQISEHFVLLKQ